MMETENKDGSSEGVAAAPCSAFLSWFNQSQWAGAGKNACELARAAWIAAILEASEIYWRHEITTCKTGIGDSQIMVAAIKSAAHTATETQHFGSAIAHQSRRRVWEELNTLKTRTASLEAVLQKEPDGVIPWIQLQSLSEATSLLLFAAGHVNALRLAGVSPNGALCDGDEPSQTLKSKQS